MIALRLAVRSVTRRGWSLLLIVAPAALLFAMLTFLFASEAAVRQLLQPGIAARAFRVGSVSGISWERQAFTQPLVDHLATIPGATPAPAQFERCYVDPTESREFNCSPTNRTYIQIWAMDMPVSEPDLDRWDAVPNGAIVTAAQAAVHHWKVGDHISLHYNDAERKDKPLELVITSIQPKYIDSTTLYFHIAYYNQRYNTTLKYWVVWILVDKAENRKATMERVDKELNDVRKPHIIWPMETSQGAILGASLLLRQVFRMAGIASFLLVVCVTVALLIISIEQRQTEFATLMAIGFRRHVLARSILLEGMLLLLPAALLGAVCVWVPYHDKPIMFDMLFRVKVSSTDALTAIIVGALVGFGAAIIPGWRVLRVDVLSSLR